MLAVAKKFVEHVGPAVIRPARIVWNQSIAFLFLTLALIGGIRAQRMVREYDGSFDGFLGTAVAVLFAAIMAAFGLSSLLRARKISRS